VPLLQSLGLRVIVPDLLGYGRTDAPQDLSEYTFRSMSDDMAALVRHVCSDTQTPQILLGGHDWGAAFGFRLALWHPEIIKGYFSVCVPFAPPAGKYVELEELVKSHVPNFRYQLQFSSPEIEEGVKSKQQIRDFLNAMYGGRAPSDKETPIFMADRGIRLDLLGNREKSPLMSEEEIDFYVDEFARKGMRGPTNWYRLRKLNHEEELELVKKGPEACRLKIPVLFIAAQRDVALPPAMSAGMEGHFDGKFRRELVDSSHWALLEAAPEVNRIIKEWIDEEFPEGFRASL
jgi:pimeloyl-ACP methyl ester carboxylesterase